MRWPGTKPGHRAAVSAAVLALAVLAAPASAWDRPLRLSDTFSSFPEIDRQGTIRLLQSTRRHRVEAGLLRWGTPRFRHCGVPGVRQQTDFMLSAWDSNDAGQMLFGWSVRAKHPRFRIASAGPGRCFRRRLVRQRVVPKKPTLFGIRLGSLGTMLAVWILEGKPGRFLGAGPLGGTIRRVGKENGPRRGLRIFDSDSAVISGDRLMRTWLTRKSLGKGRYRETIWGAVGAPRGGRLGRARQVAHLVGHKDGVYPDPESDATFAAATYYTDRHGGQVAAWFGPGGFHVMARRPGRSFGRPRVIPAARPFAGGFEGSANGRGDVVFAWETDPANAGEDVYALVRRRGGRIVGPQLVSRGDDPRTAAEPSVGIDGAGRALVAYKAQDAESSQIFRSQIRVVVSGRRGRFGAPFSVSGPATTFNLEPEVVVNARGQAAVWWERDVELPDGNFTHHFLMSRGRVRR